jgi:hypothetical protein
VKAQESAYNPPVAQRLPRYYRRQLEAEDAQKIEKIILEGRELESDPGRPLRQSADGHSSDRRRGLPVISKGVGGASPGTDPLRALLAKESRGARRGR